MTKIIIDKGDLETVQSMVECGDYQEALRIIREVLKESG